jgi:glycosyltransferase involved in cell wall biosynthesis
VKRRRSRTPRALIIVQNLPVPFDRRVWLESQALTNAGVDVTVICPKGPGDPARQHIDGVSILKYQPYAPGGSAISFAMEYAYSFSRTLWLTLQARRQGAFQVVQACNPPDIFWPIARLLRRLDGTASVFDHHDLCPELFESRFPDGPRAAHRGLLFLERMTLRTADHVTSTNESYAEIAMQRGGKGAEDVTVVRTGPDEKKLNRVAPAPAMKRGRRYLAAYVGVMGPQDGVDVAVRAADHIVNTLGRTDISFLLMGAGDSYDELVELRDRLGLQDYVELPGRVSDEFLAQALSTADVGLSPDPLNPLNNVSTMNKTMEYMAFGLPVLAFDLRETRVSAGSAARYARPNDVTDYAEELVRLLEDADSRRAMGSLARATIEDELAWRHQEKAYVGVYRRLLSATRSSSTPRPAASTPSGE